MSVVKSLQHLRPAARRTARFLRRLRGRRPAYPPPHPPLEPGWLVAPPDFVGLGAHKAGTSWWYSLVAAHPRVRDRGHRVKELHYFDRFFLRPFGRADIEAYHRYFARPPGMLAGEWTPGYLSDFWMPPLLHRAAPEARLLVLLRDPVDRYRSGLTHTAGMSRARLKRGDAVGEFARGLYADQLDHLFAWFPPERVLVLQYERCRRDPRGELDRTFDFLGLERQDPGSSAFERRVNETITRKVDVPDDVIDALTIAYRPQMDRLCELVPTLDLSLWPTFAA